MSRPRPVFQFEYAVYALGAAVICGLGSALWLA